MSTTGLRAPRDSEPDRQLPSRILDDPLPEEETSSSGPDLHDILYSLFCHKWKILALGSIGLVAAAIVYFDRSPYYESQARLLVRYVLERSAVDPYETKEEAGGRYSAHVINAEIAILTSWDLAMAVTKTIGPERLLPDAGEGEEAPTAVRAARRLRDSLEIDVREGSNVIDISYHHVDPEIAVEVLQVLVDEYFDRHLDIHRSIGALDFVRNQANDMGERLRRTETELQSVKVEAGVVSLDESAALLETERTQARQEFLAAEAELIAQEARVKALEKMLGKDEGEAATREEAAEAVLPEPGAVEATEYHAVLEQLESLRRRKSALLAKFTPENRIVVATRAQIEELESRRRELLVQFPALAASSGNAPSGDAGRPLLDLVAEKANLASIEARAEQLRAQLEELDERSRRFTEAESTIASLERQKELEDENYRYLESSLEKARVDETLDPSKMPNISVVQQPSPPLRTAGERPKKLLIALAGGGFASGIGLALFLGLVLDRSVKRPIDLETRLRIPLLLSVPDQRPPAPLPLLEKRDASGRWWERLALPRRERPAPAPPRRVGDLQFIRPFSDAIRDRLYYYFEVNQMTHKPKLVALTGSSSNAGTSTHAAGLAAAFAETIEGKVLLVDMNGNHGEENPWFHGQPAPTLASALEPEVETPPVGPGRNLFCASATSRHNGSASFALRKLYDLRPRFRSSDFDYIIFDMPPIGPTSPTVAMAGFMDTVLLVVDAEQNDREALKRGYLELARSGAEISCIFNKTRAPRWVQGEPV